MNGIHDRVGEPLAAGAVAPGPRRRVRRGSFGGDVVKLVTGTVLAQGITVLLSPILTRLYAPSAFGVWAVFSSITSIIGVIACLRYDVAIMLPEDDGEGASLLGVSLLALVLVTLLVTVAVMLAGPAIVAALKAPDMARWLWLVPIAVLVNGLMLALSAWASRGRRFALLAGARVGASVTSSAVQLGAGFAIAANAGSLIASSIAGTGLSSAVLVARTEREDVAVLRQGLRWGRLRHAIHRYRKFAIYGSPSILLNTVSWQLPAILLQRFFDSEVVGLYALGTRLLRVPMDLVGGAISQAFYPRAAAAHAEGRLADVAEAAYRRLVTLGFAPLVVLGIVASDLFRVVFGSRWVEAGVYTQILSVWTFFWFISSPLSSLFSVLEMQEFGLKLNVVILVTRFLSLLAGGLMGKPRFALAFFAISGVIVYGYYSFAVLSAAGVRWSRALGVLGAGVAAVSPIAAVLVAGKLLHLSPWLEVAVAGLLLAGFFAVAVRRDPALLAMVKAVRLPGS